MSTQNISQSIGTRTAGAPWLPTLKGWSLFFVLVGVGISGYLTYVKFTDSTMICAANGVFDCETVRNSIYSMMFGVPIAFLGLLTYLVIGGLLLVEDRTSITREVVPLLTFGVVLFAFLYSMWLIYVQAVILQAFCQWCLMHEANMTVLFGLTLWRTAKILRSEEAEPQLA